MVDDISPTYQGRLRNALPPRTNADIDIDLKDVTTASVERLAALHGG